jgi:hypothetical protein
MKTILLRVGLLVVLAGGSFASGYYLRSPETVTVTDVQTQTVEKVVIQKEVIKVVAPDGTVTETVKETSTEDKNAVVKDKSKGPDEKIVAAEAARIKAKRDYSLGLVWKINPDELKDSYKPQGFVAGRRIVADVWGEAGYDWADKEVVLGLRLEF